MTVRIVMGTPLSGKTYFIKKHFSGSEILSVGEYQRRIADETGVGDYMPIEEYRELLQNANDQIKSDMIERLQQNKDAVMEHTLYKAKRRKEYIDAFRKVTDVPIDIYVMQPSDEQLLINIQAEGKNKDRGIGWIKSELRAIEIPTKEEGFAHIFVVNEKGIQEWSDKPHEIKIINSSTNIMMKVCKEKRDASSINGFGKLPFKHICEVCGKVKVMTSKEAHEEGWDYPGEEGIYKSMPGFGFGIMSPRTCEKCGMEDTAYWELVVEEKSVEQLDERKKQAIERIVQEPNILKV